MSHQLFPLDPILAFNPQAFPAEPLLVTCRCAIGHGHECGAILLADRVMVAGHLRNAHALGGWDSKERVPCCWGNCHSRHIQQQSLIRHVLSVHLGLLRWTCPLCFKTFSRKATRHQCHVGEMSLQA